MMETRALIEALRWQPGNMAFSPQLRKEAADRLEKLQRFVDDMLGDHYVDYLEFYANRCRELEDKLEEIKNIII